jgi:hypothetical protein
MPANLKKNSLPWAIPACAAIKTKGERLAKAKNKYFVVIPLKF